MPAKEDLKKIKILRSLHMRTNFANYMSLRFMRFAEGLLGLLKVYTAILLDHTIEFQLFVKDSRSKNKHLQQSANVLELFYSRIKLMNALTDVE